MSARLAPVLSLAAVLGACTADPAPRSSVPPSVTRTAESEPMVLTELDAVATQVARCWNVPMVREGKEDMTVEIRVFLASDGSLQRAEPVDKERIARDRFYRVHAESAIRAVKRCSPLKLPPKEYEAWKEMVLVSDPGERTAR